MFHVLGIDAGGTKTVCLLADDQGQTELPLEASAGWRKRELPFGVFLAPAAMIALLFGDAIIGWYLRISGL